MAIKAENYLPYLSKEVVTPLPPEESSAIGTQIGQIINTPEDIWEDINGDQTFRLLPANGNEYDTEVFSQLYDITGSDTLATSSAATGSPFPNKVVADNAIPPIGTILRTSNDYVRDNGEDVNDLLVCDGDLVAYTSYPVLYKAYNYVNLGYTEELLEYREIFSLVSVNAGDNPARDFTDESLDGYDVTFGRTYAEGEGIFLQTRESTMQDVTYSETYSNSGEMMSPNVQVYCVNNIRSGNTSSVRVTMKDLEGTDIFELYLRAVGTSTSSFTVEYTYGGNTYTFTNITDTSMSVNTSYDRVEKEVTLDFRGTAFDTIPLDMGDVATMVIEGEVTTSSSSSIGALACVRFGIPTLPTNTSPYPDYPDKIVADYTGGT